MISARGRLAVSLVVGVAAAGAVAPFAPWPVTAVTAWIGVALSTLVLVWAHIWRADPTDTHATATREDDSRFTFDVLLVGASLASLAGVGVVLLKASNESGATLALLTGASLLSVVLAWTVVHTVFTLRYAHLYWTQGKGIDFNNDEPDDRPDYRDFAYLAFTIGMTYQVSDTSLTNRIMRRTALGHAVLSYVFGTAIIAVTINAVVSLVH